jgi:hypothetical protein
VGKLKRKPKNRKNVLINAKKAKIEPKITWKASKTTGIDAKFFPDVSLSELMWVS